MPPTSGLRERKKRDRRRRIEDVAIDLFVRQGFDATTIEQIAAAADIAPRTFFSYFATKDDLVLADYTDRLDRILHELDQRPAEEPAWEALRASFATVADDYAAEADRLRRRFKIMAANPSVFARSLNKCCKPCGASKATGCCGRSSNAPRWRPRVGCWPAPWRASGLRAACAEPWKPLRAKARCCKACFPTA